MNLSAMDQERLIDASWREDILESGKNELYKASLKIYGKNRTGMLVDISRVFTEANIDIRMMQSRVAKTGTATIEVSFGAKSTEELRAISEKLRSVEGVIDIERTRS
jgi:GTP pyrophosphokinase